MTRIAFCLAASLVLAACASETTQSPKASSSATEVSAATSPAPSLRRQFECLPEEAAFIAAHRGTSKGEGLAENSASALKALIDAGITVAEVDVAGLKDGTHILFHDGVWDEKSTGNGPVAASSWADAEKILLQDTDGDLTADRPVKLVDALAIAKDRLYLEIDFKSSAKYETVIEAVRDAGMANQVILIAYNDAQARKMAKLAPEMMLSVGVSEQGAIEGLEQQGVKRENMNAWVGRGPYDKPVIDRLQKAGLHILAWPGRAYVDETAGLATLVVSDYALNYDGIIGLSDVGRANYESCLANG